MYHVTSEQMECFLTLAKIKNYRETSEMLFITQPTVTKQIQKLEKELGKALFHRSTQNVELTEAGQYLAESWAPLYQRFLDSIDEMNVLTAKSNNTLTISVLRDYESDLSAEYLAEMFEKYLIKENLPPVSLTFRFLSMREQREMLRKHLVDFNFSLDFDYDTLRSIESIELSKQHIFALLPPEHPLSGRDSISIQELEHDVFLVLSSAESIGINTVTVSMLRKLLPRARIENVPNLQTMAFSLKRRKGITLGNRFFVNDSDFVEVPITELKNAVYEEMLTWRNDDMTQNKALFLRFIREMMKEMP